MLKGKAAVITGGMRGIGFSAAEMFLGNEAKVAGCLSVCRKSINFDLQD